jgi:hypothetical protein
VFPAPRSGMEIETFSKIKATLVAATKPDDDGAALDGWTWHDFGRSFASALGEAGRLLMGALDGGEVDLEPEHLPASGWAVSGGWLAANTICHAWSQRRSDGCREATRFHLARPNGIGRGHQAGHHRPVDALTPKGMPRRCCSDVGPPVSDMLDTGGREDAWGTNAAGGVDEACNDVHSPGSGSIF